MLRIEYEDAKNSLEDSIPDDIQEALDEVESGKDRPNVPNPHPYANDGRGGSHTAPGTDADGNPIKYMQHYVNPKPPKQDRDKKRILMGSDGSRWYTLDHADTPWIPIP